MKIYLDLCAIQRPLDTPNQVRIVLESEAVLGIVAMSGTEQVELLSSEALLYEGEQSSLPIRREHALAVLSKAKSVIDVTLMRFIWLWQRLEMPTISAHAMTACYETQSR